MSRTRTMRRLAVPAAAAVGALALAGGAGIVWANAGGEDTKSPEDLLGMIQKPDVQGLTGTVDLTSGLDLPSLETGGADLTSLANGGHTLNVWSAGTDQQRVSLAGDQAADVVRDGNDLYAWNSLTGEAVHESLPGDLPAMPALPGLPVGGVPSLLTMTPDGIADQVVETASTDPSSVVMKVKDTADVAGRDVQGLVISMADKGSLIDHVTMSVDSQTGVPLATEVFTTASPDNAVVDARYAKVDFDVPDSSDLELGAPDDVTIQDVDSGTLSGLLPVAGDLLDLGGDTLGVNALELTQTELVDNLVAQGADPAAVEGLLSELQPVEGGGVLETPLFTMLVSDDGAVYYGTVTKDVLLETASVA